jgi:ATP-dependent Lon protease
VRLVRGEQDALTVTPPQLREVLDAHPLPDRHVPESARPGVVTGLAWTPVGGEILYIETLVNRGSGKLTITGQLGEVMRESAQIAISLVKLLYADQAETLNKSDLHIHVPDGATPKDGPSAGITLTTALASQLTGCAVPPSVAMTGEVSLQGDVNPIGGLPEKLMAAQRAGVERVFIPKDNMDDLKDVAEEVKLALEIRPVSTVQEVLSALGLPVAAPIEMAACV